MWNHEEKSTKLKITTLIGNVLLWLLLLPSMLFAFGSIFAADAGFTSALQEAILLTAISIAFHSPIIILAGAITSLMARTKQRYKLSFVLECISFGLVALSISLFVLAAYIT